MYKIILLLLVASCCSATSNHPLNNPEKETFRFYINADPQMGPQSTDKKGLKILNELLEMFVEDVNEHNKKSPIDFVVYNGDMVWDPYQDAFDNFVRIVKDQEVPTVLVHGNHDGYNDDPKFHQAQQVLSGYQKLNYSFDYGQWHMVVMAAPEKYMSKPLRQKQLAWLQHELEKHKDKNIMLFMHYHIMPIGLSQMEFYTYWPMSFKNAILDAITKHGNVKYAFTGHVHSGVKGSVKSSVEYKGTKFVNSPTPVMGRPFGEEYSEYETNPFSRYFRRGFYMEVVVDGEDVQLIGHKIDHDYEVRYPKEFKIFTEDMDPRFFKPESQTKPNKYIINPSFDEGLKGWQTSYRYKKDSKPAFNNFVNNGKNVLKLNAPWGSWSFDEYMETYQIVELDLSKHNHLIYQFEKPIFSKQGAGGYIKLNFYNNQNEREEMAIFHWGYKKERVKFMYQSWFYNSKGERGGSREFNNLLNDNDILSMALDFDKNKQQVLEIDINNMMAAMDQPINESNISKISVSHGVWSRILMKESKIKSVLRVEGVYLSSDLYEYLENLQQELKNHDNRIRPVFFYNKFFIQPLINQDLQLTDWLIRITSLAIDSLEQNDPESKSKSSTEFLRLNQKVVPLAGKDTTIPYFDFSKIKRNK